MKDCFSFPYQVTLLWKVSDTLQSRSPTLQPYRSQHFTLQSVQCSCCNLRSQTSLPGSGIFLSMSTLSSCCSLQCLFKITSIRRRGYFFFSLHVFVRLLFEGGVYFFGKPTDINVGWIGYVGAIQLQLLDAVSSKCSLSVLMSAMETSCTTQTALAPAWWPSSEVICTRVCCRV